MQKKVDNVILNEYYRKCGCHLNGQNIQHIDMKGDDYTMAMTLKAIRVNLGLDQEEAAEKLGIKSRTLSNWENAKTFPNAPQIARIERVYGVHYEDINFLLENVI